MENATVLLVHGLYMNRLWLVPLAWQLHARGWRVELFAYPSLLEPPAAAARRLARRLRPADLRHAVGHSLGGLVLRHLYAQVPELPPGRVVTLGTPHAGSAAARHLAALGAGWALGASRARALFGDAPPWPAAHELGVIAGTRPLGLAQWLAPVPTPGDGVVGVTETLCPGMRDHVALPVSHSGMLFSAEVAHQVDHFLRHGRFAPAS